MKCILLIAMLLVCDISSTSAKGHRGRAHHGHGVATPLPHDGAPDGADAPHHHDSANSKLSTNDYKRDQPQGGEERNSTSQLPNAPSATPSERRGKRVSLPKEDASILHRDVREHNVNKKQLEIPDEIPMEKEFLIHVTSNSSQNVKKSKKSQAQKRRAPTQRQGERGQPSKAERGRKTLPETGSKSRKGKPRQQNPRALNGNGAKRIAKGSSKNKNHRYPKKYNSQKHSMKKNQRKDNQKKERMNEKNKREKTKEKKEKRNKRGYPQTKDEEQVI